MKTKTNGNWIEIHPNGSRTARTEREDKERLKFWSNFYSKKNQIKATCHSF